MRCLLQQRLRALAVGRLLGEGVCWQWAAPRTPHHIPHVSCSLRPNLVYRTHAALPRARGNLKFARDWAACIRCPCRCIVDDEMEPWFFAFRKRR